MRRIVTAITAASLVVLFLASCSGATSSEPTPTPSPQKTVNLFATPKPKPTLPPTVTEGKVYTGQNDPSNHAFGLKLSGDTVIYAPFAGTVHLALIEDPKNPSNKYLQVVLLAEDGPRDKVSDKTEFNLLLGIAGVDAIALVADGSKVKAGAQIAKIIGPGPSAESLDTPSIKAQVFGFWIDSAGNYQRVIEELAIKFLTPTSP